jgi:hypothetical protein
MANCVLHFPGQFTKGLLESFRDKDWIVAESRVTAHFISDPSFHNSFEDPDEIGVTRERYDAAKSSAPPIISGANSLKLAE